MKNVVLKYARQREDDTEQNRNRSESEGEASPRQQKQQKLSMIGDDESCVMGSQHILT